MKILVVDDSIFMKRIISEAAQAIGYETIGADSGQEALAILETEFSEIVAITMDINMPGMTGIDCLKALKGDPRYADIPVLMVTAEAERRRILDAVRQGASHYVIKPFSREDITDKLREILAIETES